MAPIFGEIWIVIGPEQKSHFPVCSRCCSSRHRSSTPPVAVPIIAIAVLIPNPPINSVPGLYPSSLGPSPYKRNEGCHQNSLPWSPQFPHFWSFITLSPTFGSLSEFSVCATRKTEEFGFSRIWQHQQTFHISQKSGGGNSFAPGNDRSFQTTLGTAVEKLEKLITSVLTGENAERLGRRRLKGRSARRPHLPLKLI
ncbi:hypothetical protein GPALN_012375 [Globodera pallida]|nr:hypothetical protein GPALN_012375 [Globodera pallida]